MKRGEVLRVVGMNGQIELHEDRVVISRRGMTAVLMHGFKGEKAILLSEISSIQFKESGFFSGRGFIQFSFRGGMESKGDIREIAQDENAVLFTGGQQAAFKALRDAIDEKLRAVRTGGPAKVSEMEELERLAALRDRGVVTEEEFREKKKRILGLE